MKHFPAALLSCMISLFLVGCTILDPSSAYDATSSMDTTSSDVSSPIAVSYTKVKLHRVEDELTSEDGHVLVSYAYDRPTVTIPGNQKAQKAVQASLDQLLEEEVSYLQEELLPLAQKNYQALGKDARSAQAELNLSVQRSDNAVISVLADEILDTGGAHGSDRRSGWNYDTQTGQQLTFQQLGDGFRDTAIALVTTQADQYAASLFEDYRNNISHVVLDGTENAETVYGYSAAISPTFYMTDQSIVFISREYELQPYAMGVLEFALPYSDFSGALNSAYLPEGYVPEREPSQESVLTQGDSSDQRDSAPEKVNLSLAHSGKLQCSGWALTIPTSWNKQVYVEEDTDSVSFFERGCYDEMGNGWLFSISAYTDESYLDLADYELLSIDRDISYVAVYPTDVQYEGASDKNAQRYNAFALQVEKVLRSFSLSSGS